MSELAFTRYIEEHGGYWGVGDPQYPIEDWQYAVANGDTRRGYWEWAWTCADADNRALT